MPLPPTPWIRTYDYPELYLKGYGTGLEQQQIRQRGAIAAAELQNRREALAQQAATAQMEMDARVKIAEQQRLQEQHRFAIEDMYRKSQLGLQEQQLAERQNDLELKTKQAAREADAQMRIAARVKAGEDYNQVVMEEGALAGTGFGPSGIAAIQRAQQMVQPKELEIKTQDGKSFFRSSPTEAYQAVPGGGEDRVMAHAAYVSGLTGLRKLEEEHRLTRKPKEKAELGLQLDAEMRRLNDIAKASGVKIPFPGARPAALPMPKTKAELVKGEIYQTNRGPAKWDGDQFIPQ